MPMGILKCLQFSLASELIPHDVKKQGEQACASFNPDFCGKDATFFHIIRVYIDFFCRSSYIHLDLRQILRVLTNTISRDLCVILLKADDVPKMTNNRPLNPLVRLSTESRRRLIRDRPRASIESREARPVHLRQFFEMT